MKKFILSILFTSLFISKNIAQQDQTRCKNFIGISVGYSFDNLNDKNLSPLNQKGKAISYTVFYEHRSENVLKIAFKYGNGNLKSGPKRKFNTSYYLGDIDISYYKNLSSSQSSTKFYFGGAYNLRILYMDWSDLDAFSFVSINGLSFSGIVLKELDEKQRIESSISIPFLQFLARPPYNGIDEFIIENQDDPIALIFSGELTSFRKYKAINWNVNYSYEAFNDFDWKLDYTFRAQKIDDINVFKSVSNNISTSVLYKF